MRQRQHQKNKLRQSQVSFQTAAKKMAVKFDLVRAGQNVKAEIDGFTHIMVAWHRFELICISGRKVALRLFDFVGLKYSSEL